MARPNRLATETSPYLLQHATNPVDWYPWGEEALERAASEQKPIFLSIGYAACHWCHVMERESFEDAGIARTLNEHFVCIKVDREERPDLDEVYLAATIALSGNGGWPMTVFLTPTGEPFFAGTYFPPSDRDGRLGLPTLLARVIELWQGERDTLLTQAGELTEAVRRSTALPEAVGVSWDSLRLAARRLALEFDPAFGGFGRAPKFPPPAALSLLLRHHRQSGDERSLHMVVRTLEAMASGGLYDQLGGGFARYSVDAEWLVPHFEKMLYDNAQLAEVYLEAYQVTGHMGFARVARETLDYLLREMQGPDGGFFSATDADSEGEEGRYYVFSAAELRRTLGEPAATHFAAYYGVTEEGNFEGKNVLTLRRSLEQVARELGIEPGRLAESVSHSRQLVLDHRSGRVPPNVDDKVLTAWNGLTIRALSLGAWVLGDQRYLESARRASRYLLAHHRDESGRLLRGSRSGQARGPAFLEDYAALTDGLLSLYEAAGGDEFLSSARELAESMLREFSSEAAGALEHVATDQPRLIAHPKPGSDGALPSPNALAARALARLGAHGLGERYRQRAVDIVRSYGSALRREPRAHTTLLAVVDFLLEPTWELSFCGSFDADEFDELERVVATRYLPNRVVARADDQGESASPLARGKTLLDGEPTAYVCRDHVCSRPTNQAGDWQRELDALDARRRDSASRELGRERLPGRATAAGTARFRERHSLDGAAHDSAFFRHDQLTISRLAFGGYRVGLDLPAHRDALALALRSCSNYFDTSPAFAWGDSERLLGEELAAAVRRGDTARDEIVVASKLGVALGVEAEELERRRQSGASPLFTVSLDPGQPWPEGAFSLDPEFLVTQLDGSLERLGLETLDVCLIQSPEHLLLAGVATTELESALSGAFALLERERQRGRVGAYGVLTNGQREELEPERLVALARSVGGAEHGLRWLALPVNAAEHDALLGQPSRLERAAALGLAVVALRPLSSLSRGALLRLVDSPVGEGDDQRLAAARYKVASLEAEFDTTLGPQLRLAGLLAEEAVLDLASRLGPVLERTLTFEQFDHAERTLVGPRLRGVLAELDRAQGGEAAWPPFRQRYVAAVGEYLNELRSLARRKGRARLDELEQSLTAHPQLGPLFSRSAGRPWLERALDLLWSSPGVGLVALGMRSAAQVQAGQRAWQAPTA